MKTFITLFVAATSGSASLRFIEEVAQSHAGHATLCFFICAVCSILAWNMVEDLKHDARMEVFAKWIASTKLLTDALANKDQG